MAEIFITTESAVVPVVSDGFSLMQEPVVNDNGFLRAVEPDYTGYLSPLALRRMSRMLKNGLTCALMCVKESGVTSPDAIITATGYGCIEDTVSFLSKVTHENRQALNPTPFIQSTHNAVAGVIALHLKCNSYNNTFTQRGFSFESALVEALLLLEDQNTNNVLIGGMDEMVEPVDKILKQIRTIRPEYKMTVPLGEGTVFLNLSRTPSADSVMIAEFETLYRPGSDQTAQSLVAIIEKHGNPDMILTGNNGSDANDRYYQWLNSYLPDTPIIDYKKYCGEYPTAASFAHWLACRLVKGKAESGLAVDPRSVLVYNHHENRNHSFTLIKR